MEEDLGKVISIHRKIHPNLAMNQKWKYKFLTILLYFLLFTEIKYRNLAFGFWDCWWLKLETLQKSLHFGIFFSIFNLAF
jgi:hypothetical protein